VKEDDQLTVEAEFLILLILPSLIITYIDQKDNNNFQLAKLQELSVIVTEMEG
ncbi:21742_t:CDS:1, partial [Gigaspora rosea]